MKFIFYPKDADLQTSIRQKASIAMLHLGGFFNKDIAHLSRPSLV
jgi:hypothetical protein